MEMTSFGPGDVIFREGDIGDTPYLLASGYVQISRNQDGKPVVHRAIDFKNCKS